MSLNPDDFTQRNQQAMDEQLLVRFFVKPKQDAAATAEAGRPIYKDTEYIEIKVPGDRAGGVCRPARQRDKDRFHRHYAAYKNRVEEAPQEGTPLSEWTLITRSQAEELSHFNIKTVEQLAQLNDSHAQQFMGINALKTKAQEWLAASKKVKEAEHLEQELSRRDAEIAELKSMVSKLMETKPAPRKRAAKVKAVS